MKKYSRRQFTKLAAAGGICAAVGALTGCLGAATDSSDNISSANSMADSDTPTDKVSSDSTSESNSLTGSNLLIAYFSCTGTTEQIARWVADATGADIYEIIPDDPYTEEDLAYYTGGRADQEQADLNARPAISDGVENMEQYDFIFLGYPIVLSGMNAMEQMQDNMQDISPLSPKEYLLLEQVSAILKKSISIPCNGCRYCAKDCPQSIAIPDYFHVYNTYRRYPEDGWKIKPVYDSIARANGKISDCIHCHACERNCPQQIPVTKWLSEVEKTFA